MITTIPDRERALQAQVDALTAELARLREQEPVAWKHDCAALCTNDVELWIDACPHCGKPRTAAPPAQPADETLPLSAQDRDQRATPLTFSSVRSPPIPNSPPSV